MFNTRPSSISTLSNGMMLHLKLCDVIKFARPTDGSEAQCLRYLYRD